MAQIISYVLFYGMLAALVVLIGLSLRESVIRRRRVDAPMLEAARVSAESAKASAEAARASAEAAKRLADHLESGTHA